MIRKGKYMPESGCRWITDEQEQKLRIAVEHTCELCHEYYPASHLEIHSISRHQYKEMKRDPSARILVLCPFCHDHIHRLPLLVRNQRELVRMRSFFVRRDMRRILGYRPAPYLAPDDIDLSAIYEEYFRQCPPGSYRLCG
jgi:hypothetical protein